MAVTHPLFHYTTYRYSTFYIAFATTTDTHSRSSIEAAKSKFYAKTSLLTDCHSIYIEGGSPNPTNPIHTQKTGAHETRA